jgi:hypothetical protein
MAAASIALAQQAAPQTPAQPPASATPQEQTTPPSDPSARTSSPADQQALMKDCLTQVQAANPNVPAKDIQAYCDKQVKSSSSPQD